MSPSGVKQSAPHFICSTQCSYLNFLKKLCQCKHCIELLHDLTDQRDRGVVDVPVGLRDCDLLDAECNAMEAELSGDVHSSKLHVHGNHLHRPHAPTAIDVLLLSQQEI